MMGVVAVESDVELSAVLEEEGRPVDTPIMLVVLARGELTDPNDRGPRLRDCSSWPVGGRTVEAFGTLEENSPGDEGDDRLGVGVGSVAELLVP